ncbi:MAG: hypothetical protein ACR2GN_04660 [Bacteroidia bacterium]
METEKVKLENKISKIIEEDNNCSSHFEYNSVNGKTEVTIITYNPIHHEQFVLKKEVAESYESALKKILDFLENTRKNQNTYTLVWLKKGENKTRRSYFTGSDMKDVLEKFYHNKTSEDYIIYEIKLNPES